MGSLYANAYDDNLPANPSRPPSNPGKMPKTTSAQNGEASISKMNGKLRIIFSVMGVLFFVVTWAVIGVQFHWLSRLNNQNIVSAPACSMNVRHDSDHVTLSASGSLDSQTGANSAKLDGRSTTASKGAWCGRPGKKDWIEIKFDGPRRVAGIVTQGNPQDSFWTTSYRVACLTDEGAYEDYAENGKKHDFTGNTDQNGKVFNIFYEPMTCQAIRITPLTENSVPCLRVDLLHDGCYAPTRLKFVVTSKGWHDNTADCSIKVNGVEKAKPGRGFCVVSFDPTTSAYKPDSFDTHGDPNGQSALMTSFLGGLESNSIVAIAVMDEAIGDPKVIVSDSVAAQFKDLGADEDPSCNIRDLGYRDSYAFIGQKVDARSDRPNWISCQHVEASAGHAVVKATITTKRRFVIP